MILRTLAWGGLTVLAASCGGAEAKPTPGGRNAVRPPAGVVDSILPRDTSIARFTRSLPKVSFLQGGAASRDRLVRRFITALERPDTATLRSLVLTKSEFGWLYYPTHPEGLPPYSLTPQLMWFMLEGRNGQGYQKLLARRSGRPLHYLGYSCEGEPSEEGENTVWGPCIVLRRGVRGDTISERLFGQIIARDRQYKFVSYSNKL